MILFTSCCKEKSNESYCGSFFEEPAQQYTDVVNIDTQNTSYKKQGENNSKPVKQQNKRTYVHVGTTVKINETVATAKINEVGVLDENYSMSDILNSPSVVHIQNSIIHTHLSAIHLKQSLEHAPLDKKLDQNSKITDHVEVDHFVSSESSSEPEDKVKQTSKKTDLQLQMM